MIKRLFQSVAKRISRVLNLAKGPAFVVVVGLGLLSLFSSTSVTLRVPIKPFLVTSGSMRPTIPEGSVVFVDRKTQHMNVGDVVTFLRPGNALENVTHRIASVEEKDGKTVYKTKGDANNAQDIWSVRREAIWGKVIFSVPLLGYVISFTKTRLGVLFVVVLPLTIIALDELRVIINEIRRWKKKKSAKGKTSATTLTALFLLVSYGFVAVATQTSISGFSDTTSATNQQVTTSCWVAPSVPTLISPIDDYSTSNTDVTFTWSSTTSSCPMATIQYNFQIYSDAGLTTLVFQSGYAASLTYTYSSIPAGEYWWRVQTQDQFGNMSESTAYHIIVDRTAPTASLSVSGSWLKEVKETVNNGNFATGDTAGWTTAGSVQVLSSDDISNPTTTIIPQAGSYMARIGNPDDPGNFVWENRLMQSFDSGAKSLSVHYNFWSRDFAWDMPGFFIRLNGQEIFQQNDLRSDLVNADTTGWQQFIYDLSNISDPKVNLAIYAGNTNDTITQSWVYIDEVTTYFVSAPAHAVYTITGTDSGGAGIDHYEYRIDTGSWTIGSTFSVPAGGIHTIDYRSVDSAGNTFTATVKLITDATAPSAIGDLAAASVSTNSATLTWTAPGNDDGTPPTGRAASYNIRYSDMGTALDCSTFSFDTATSVDKPPAPQNYSKSESLEILGLNPSSNYCFAIKSSDEAPNTSTLSNVVFATTLAGTTVNPGDVVINELLWMGTSVSYADEYLELRNMTGRTVVLTGLTLTKFDGSGDVTMAIDLTGKTIAPYGYFLIANGNAYAGGDSQLIDSLAPNMWDASLDLSDTDLQIKLMQGTIVIDVAWDGTAPTEGLYDPTPGSEKYYSMERISTPSNGANPLEWYTTIDSASTTDFFDGDADERGTPGTTNRSENEPLARQSIVLRDTAAPEETTPSADISSSVETPTESTPSAQPSQEEAATVSGILIAQSIDSKQESSSTPAPQESPIPTPTPEPIAQPSPTPELSVSPTPEPTPQSTIEPTPPVEPTATPEPPAEQDLAPRETPTPQPTPTQPADPTPTLIADTL